MKEADEALTPIAPTVKTKKTGEESKGCRRQWYLRNKERAASLAKARYALKREAIIAQQREYRERIGKEKISEYSKDYYRRNKAKKDAVSMANYFAKHETEKKRRRDYYANTKSEAKARNGARYIREKVKFAARSKAWHDANRDSANKRTRENQRKNPERHKAYHAKYNRSEKGIANSHQKCAKRRARIAGCEVKVTKAELIAIRAAAKGKCHYCHQKKPLTFDHVIPLAKGGAHSRSNLVMACGSCNSSKGAKDPAEFARTLGLLLV